jgi:glucans biosynthesis protein
MHGGAPGSGAPKGNRNRLVHGHYSARAVAARRLLRAMLRQARDLNE